MHTIPEFGTPREHEERRDGGCGVVFDPKTQKYAVARYDIDGYVRLFSGGIDDGEDIQSAILREITEESGLYDFLYVEKIAEAVTHYRNVLKNVNRLAHATCFLVILKSNSLVPTKLEPHEKFSLDWVTKEEILEDWNSRNEEKDLDHWLYFFEKAIVRGIELGYIK